ncbi:hypothetical protein [Amphibiibacter pelophylacis]|uniref:Uncharacterized protein n=1 Tax=Amphibiibacter pelophylacis TaxID=1799477 RepID=A0ACC6P4K5_9BURK
MAGAELYGAYAPAMTPPGAQTLQGVNGSFAGATTGSDLALQQAAGDLADMRQQPPAVQWEVLASLRTQRLADKAEQLSLMEEMQALHTRAAKGQRSVQDTARADAIVSRLSQLEFSDQDLRKSTVAQLQAMQIAGLTNPASHREWAEGSGEAIGSSRLAFTGLTAARLASRISMLKTAVQEAKAAVAVTKSEAQAVAKAREGNNLYRDGAQFESNIFDGVPKANLRLEYEQASRDLLTQAQKMQATGFSEEQAARWAVDRRNQLKVEYRALTPPEEVAKYETRNLKTYGSKLGPTVEQLRKQGYGWQQIIEKSARPGGGDQDFSPPGFRGNK